MGKSFMLLSSAVVLLTFCGCASAPVMSRAMTLKPQSAKNPEWLISAKAENGPFTGYLTFYINDQEVAKGELSQLSPRKTMSWNYNGEKIEAECSLSREGSGMVFGHNCDIYRNGKNVTTLKF
jgi:hypothetical protein